MFSYDYLGDCQEGERISIIEITLLSRSLNYENTFV